MPVIEIDNKQFFSFRVSDGMQQRCKLTRDLFNLYGDMRIVLDEWNGRVSMAGDKISNLDFADDTTVIEETEDEMVAFEINITRKPKLRKQIAVTPCILLPNLKALK